jgi:hypothetical protein
VIRKIDEELAHDRRCSAEHRQRLFELEHHDRLPVVYARADAA